ncbi:hypothetical protein FBZ91_11443 [Nitrospirillum viridazoti]|nr:hypothetical protein FBZ91_11443 [Nitrospirillum amazonense]
MWTPASAPEFISTAVAVLNPALAAAAVTGIVCRNFMNGFI